MSTKSPIKNIIKDESDRKAASNQVRNGDMIKQEPEDEHALLSDPEDYLEENESLDMNLTNGTFCTGGW